MITIFGSSLGALWPWFLAAIPLGTAFLVYLFRAKGIANPRVASSLFLLRQLPEYLPSRRRFIPPLQFWLELLVCILLALGVSGIFSSENGERIAVLLDNSKSMATRQATGDSRLESARRIAQSDISTSPRTTRFTVLAGSSLHVNSRASSKSDEDALTRPGSSSSALKALREIQQSYEADRLQAALDTVVASQHYDAVWVYTDKERIDQSINPQLKIVTIPSDASSLSNVWIESLELKTPATANQATSQSNSLLQVHVGASGPRSQSVTISATCTDTASGSTFSPASSSVSIREATTRSVALGPLDRAWSYCRVQLRPQDSTSQDVLALDDEAWITNSSASKQVALFSSLSPRELGLQALPYDVRDSRSISESDGVTQAIYHRTLPDRSLTAANTASPPAPTVPSLLVMPPAGSALWSNGKVSQVTAKSLAVTRWESSHPLLQYVQPDLISIPSAVLITCPDSAKPILFAAAGALACAGEEAGVRYVITGFEIFPFDGLRSATVSIFTLNALRWLFANQTLNPGSEQPRHASMQEGSVRVGQLLLPPDTSGARMIAPQELSLSSGKSRNTSVPVPGIVAVSKEVINAQKELLLAANSFSTEESDLSRRNTIRAPTIKTAPPPESDTSARGVFQRGEKTFFEQTFIVLLLAVLIADLIRRIATRSRWGNTA